MDSLQSLGQPGVGSSPFESILERPQHQTQRSPELMADVGQERSLGPV